jgi:hypothetical protein
LGRQEGLAAKFVIWHRGRVGTNRRVDVTLRVVQSDCGNLSTSPDNQSPDRRKNETDNE